MIPRVSMGDPPWGRMGDPPCPSTEPRSIASGVVECHPPQNPPLWHLGPHRVAARPEHWVPSLSFEFLQAILGEVVSGYQPPEVSLKATLSLCAP